jgi:hypothetical protein
MLKRANVCVDVNLIRREEHGSILSRSLAVCLERIHNIKAFADLFLTRKHCIFALAANATAACNLDQTSIYFFFCENNNIFVYTHLTSRCRPVSKVRKKSLITVIFFAAAQETISLVLLSSELYFE